MKSFIIFLLFASITKLTPNPINIINSELVLSLEKPISAVTTGARVLLDVTSMVKASDLTNVIDARRTVEELFPEESISARLCGKDGSIVALSYDGGSLWRQGRLRLSLVGDVPVKTKWDTVTIRSDANLIRVAVFWQNHKK